MKDINKWLDAAKKKSGSDYKTSQILGVTRQAISCARNANTLSNDNCLKLAMYLEVNPLEIIGGMEAKRRPQSAKLWAKYTAASAVLTLLIFALSPDNSYSYISYNDSTLYTLCATWCKAKLKSDE